jgi:hypothetical protein
MYSGFNVDINQLDIPKRYLSLGREQYEANQDLVRKKISSFIRADGKIDAGYLQKEWFPTVGADVFMSHSHNDLDRVISFAGWLQEQGIECFVDSCVWGNAAKLLLEIDKTYCWQPDRGVYDYNLRNFSTSHVHMLLSVALTKMIDKCECLFFLNTPNSITSKEVVSETASPWLYHELSMTSLVRQKKWSDFRRNKLEKGFSVNEGLQMSFPVNLKELTVLGASDIVAWEKMIGVEAYPLDALYRHVNKRTKPRIL